MPRLAARLPFAVPPPAARRSASFADAARAGGFDYVLLFESSGMYRGEEIVPLLVAAGDRPAGRGVGQPPAVGARHRGVVPVPLPAQRRRRAGQLRRQPRAQPRVPGRSTAATLRTRCPACARCARPMRSTRASTSRAQARQPRAARRAAAAQGGDPRTAGAVLSAVAGSRHAHERARRPARARRSCSRSGSRRRVSAAPTPRQYAADAAAPTPSRQMSRPSW